MGVAVIGQKVGPRRAALTGAILGTLPDLDVFLAPDDPIDAFVQHRGWSHSLLVHAALAPLELPRLACALEGQRDDSRGRRLAMVAAPAVLVAAAAVVLW